MSIDLRTRSDAEMSPIEARAFFGETLPGLAETRDAALLAGAGRLGLEPFCVETDGEAWTLEWSEGHVRVRPGRHGSARVRLDPGQLSDVVNDQSTPIALMSNGLLDMPEGGLPEFLNWWLVLRALLDGRRVHAPGDVRFETRGRGSFEPDTPDDELRAFLRDRGYLHLRGFFSEDEMAEVSNDFAKAAPHFEKGDPSAWFATTADGREHLVRMEGFDRHSPVAAELIDQERFRRLGRIPGEGLVAARASGVRVAALEKPIGVVKGISDLPWHKDCSIGRHSYECCSLTVGISVTGADEASGQLRVVPGSHRALIWPAPCLQPGLDLAPVDLPTRTGDVTIHLSCTQHMSQSPRARTRKVLYTGFSLPPADAEAAARNRRRLDAVRQRTHTTVSQAPGYLGE